MIAYLALAVVNSIFDYSSFSVVTNINTVYEKQTTFPAVTICYGYVYHCYFDNKRCSDEYLTKRTDWCLNEFNSGLNQTLYPIEILNSTIPGEINGLELKVLPNTASEYINIFIYNQSADYDFNQAIHVYPNMRIDIVMSKVLTSKLSSPYSDCKKEYVFEPTTLDLLNKTSYPYFQSECFKLCKQKEYMKICNKSKEFDSNFQYYFTNKNQYYEFYNVELDNCLEKNASLISSVDSNFQSIGANKICEKECPMECDSISYSLTLQSNYLNSEGYSYVNIYYPDFYYTSITEQPKTTRDELVSNIGGLLGLFIGGSLLSFFEIFELLISVLVILFKKRKKTEKPLPKRAVAKKKLKKIWFIFHH